MKQDRPLTAEEIAEIAERLRSSGIAPDAAEALSDLYQALREHYHDV